MLTPYAKRDSRDSRDSRNSTDELLDAHDEDQLSSSGSALIWWARALVTLLALTACGSGFAWLGYTHGRAEAATAAATVEADAVATMRARDPADVTDGPVHNAALRRHSQHAGRNAKALGRLRSEARSSSSAPDGVPRSQRQHQQQQRQQHHSQQQHSQQQRSHGLYLQQQQQPPPREMAGRGARLALSTDPSTPAQEVPATRPVRIATPRQMVAKELSGRGARFLLDPTTATPTVRTTVPVRQNASAT